jgi:GT2 family glycosyltransferase
MDFCLRVFEAGLECIYEPAAVAFHHESLFRGKRTQKIEAMHKRSAVRLLEKHGATDMSPWTPEIL